MRAPNEDHRQSVAVIGGGVAGLTAAWLLQRKYRVDLYERNHYAGGHSCTIHIEDGPDEGTPVDMGFIVMNHRNYPMLTRILEQLGVSLGDSDMSFGYRCAETGYTYAGSGLGALFAQVGNLGNADHWRMLRDIVRFNRAASRDLRRGALNGDSLSRYLEKGRFGRPFADHYLLAMGSAIWSAPQDEVRDFPAAPFIRFFHNHGLLTLGDRPQWRYVRGGSQTYVQAMLKSLNGSLHLKAAPASVRRDADGVELRWSDGRTRRHDLVVLAAHADESLALLDDASNAEQRLLGAWRYVPNETVLHTEEAIMPENRRAWASWNFLRTGAGKNTQPVSVSYHMNRLQRLSTRHQYFVSLNLNDMIPEPRKIHSTVFTHPSYTLDSLATHEGLKTLNGRSNTYYCGSYFGYGFHEDAVRSAVDVADQLGVPL